MLKGGYTYIKGVWTKSTLANDPYTWILTETAIEYLTRMQFNPVPKYARQSVIVQNQMFRTTIYETLPDSTNTLEACIYVALRDYEDRGAMILINDMNDLLMALSAIQPATTLPFELLK